MYPTNDPTVLQQLTNRTKSSLKSGGGCIITSLVGNMLAHGANPDLGSIENIHSHRYKSYAILSVFLFISEYSKYFSQRFNNQYTLYCDNKEIVKKIQKISTTTNHFQPYYKMSEHEAIIAIQHYLPRRINVIHLYSHQDKVKGKKKLIFPEKLSNLVDTIADNYARSPLNNHIPFTPLAVTSIITTSPTTTNIISVDSVFNKIQMNISKPNTTGVFVLRQT